VVVVVVGGGVLMAMCGLLVTRVFNSMCRRYSAWQKTVADAVTRTSSVSKKVDIKLAMDFASHPLLLKTLRILGRSNVDCH